MQCKCQMKHPNYVALGRAEDQVLSRGGTHIFSHERLERSFLLVEGLAVIDRHAQEKFDGRRTWRRRRRFCGLREWPDESWGSPRARWHDESNGGSGSPRGRWRRRGVVELMAATGSCMAGPARAAWARGEGGDRIPGARRSFRCRVCAGEVTRRGSAGGALCRRRGRRCGADGAGTEEEEAQPGGAQGSKGRSGSGAAREERRRQRQQALAEWQARGEEGAPGERGRRRGVREGERAWGLGHGRSSREGSSRTEPARWRRSGKEGRRRGEEELAAAEGKNGRKKRKRRD
ncbi:hypothetical protein BRADI_1g38813v3 [Brachypodium distachyon]|uniref:Uncharacterized protein n=1 Tax=Brachypodium distachyon TaxID=15368 RepID=A0A0Q3H5D2_BRADI|nr:hypothetical protein BRADI_1g38813v3 [Brachypodium distachyon]